MFAAALLLISSLQLDPAARVELAGRSCSSGAQCQSGLCEWPKGKRLTPKRVRGVCAITAQPRDQMCGKLIVEKGMIVFPPCR